MEQVDCGAAAFYWSINEFFSWISFVKLISCCDNCFMLVCLEQINAILRPFEDRLKHLVCTDQNTNNWFECLIITMNFMWLKTDKT